MFLECGDLSPLFRGDLSPSDERTHRQREGRSRLAPASARGAHPPSGAVFRALAENRRGTRSHKVFTSAWARPDAGCEGASGDTRGRVCSPPSRARRSPTATSRLRESGDQSPHSKIAAARTLCARLVPIRVHPCPSVVKTFFLVKIFLNASAGACSNRTNCLTGTQHNRHSEARIFANDSADDQRGGGFPPVRWEKLK